MGRWQLRKIAVLRLSLDMDRPMPKAIDVISNVKRLETSGSRELINGQGNHVGVPRIASLFRKDLSRGT